jgi:EAL domain-containing protein (putative c-di-GMP-specific phosphodiesterase class I)
MSGGHEAGVNGGNVDLLQCTLDSLPLSVAVLDVSGDILMINRAWSEFGDANGGPSIGVGSNYLHVCDAATGVESALRVADGLRSIVADESSEFTMEYPCDGPDVERWFSLHAARYRGPGDARIVVTHRDVTERHRAEALISRQATLIDEVSIDKSDRMAERRELLDMRNYLRDLLRIDADKLRVLERIKTAITDDLLVLYAQPIMDLETGETAQRELLLRIQEPDGSVVLPGAFLEIAEQYGLIGEIDRWVIQRAAELAAAGPAVEINVSACSIGDLTILDHIACCLEQAGADPTQLVIEITETAIIADEASALTFAEGLHRLGCGLALDDFGTGYSRFIYLKHLPVDFLKIDIDFVRDLATSRSSQHVVNAVVALAGSFGLQTVGEGAEDAETLSILCEMGVDFAQGYHVGHPAPPADSIDETLPSAA